MSDRHPAKLTASELMADAPFYAIDGVSLLPVLTVLAERSPQAVQFFEVGG